MAAGFPTKANWATGDVLTAAQMNDLAGTTNLLAPTAKGSIKVGSAANTITDVAVGTNGQVLTADSTASTGVAWTTVSSGGMTLLSTTTLSGATTTISSISGSYTDLLLVYDGIYSSTANDDSRIKFNSDSGTNYSFFYLNGSSSTNAAYAAGAVGYTSLFFNPSLTDSTTASHKMCGHMRIYNYTSTGNKVIFSNAFWKYGNYSYNFLQEANYYGGSAISSITFTCTSFSGGTVKLYGVK